jgi:hypothetical protein
MYKLIKDPLTLKVFSVFRTSDNSWIPFDPENTDYLTFKSAVLDQQPSGLVVEDGDSFSLNTSPDDSILEDADGNTMIIEEAKAYVRTLP